MCSTYHLNSKAIKRLNALLKQDQVDPKAYANKDIYPDQKAPVIFLDKDKASFNTKTWGYPLKKDLVINARAETVLDKLFFREGIYTQRLLIPAVHFYEWNYQKEKISFFRKDQDILFMAGFYEEFQGVSRFCLITTKANASMRSVHNRMPLVLENQDLKAWLYDLEASKKILSQEPVNLAKDRPNSQLSFFDL